MIRTLHIIKSLNQLIESIKREYYKQELAIGIRFNDKSVDKVSTHSDALIETVWSILDNKHPVCKANKGLDITSIFICSGVGKTIYDSRYYTISRTKIVMRRDGDRKVINFKTLSEDEKNKVIDNLVEQIVNQDQNKSDKQIPKQNKKETSWGDLPWDFN